MNILFCCHNFKNENLRLMPWRYIYEIAIGLLMKGHEVSLLSMGSVYTSFEENIDGIRVFRTKAKDIFKERNSRFFKKADLIIWSSSPLTVLIYNRLKSLKKPLILLFTGPFYSLLDILKAQSCQVPFRQLATHYKNAILSLRLTAVLANSNFVRAAVVLSEKNAIKLKKKGCSDEKIKIILPGYDEGGIEAFVGVSKEEVRMKIGLPKDKKIVMYLGSLHQIRGINMLLDAFHYVSKTNEDILLLILARTDNEKEINALVRRMIKIGVEKRVMIVSGFLDKDKVQSYIYASDVVVLPFILVPSDMPLGALEAMALGKPVITTDVDGMPEMVTERGAVVKPGDTVALSIAILSLTQDYILYNSQKDNCTSFMSKYPSWEDTTNNFCCLIQQNAEC